MTEALKSLWNRIPKRVCRNLVSAFDVKIKKIKDNGERANKREPANIKGNPKKKIKRFSGGRWKNKWNKNDYIENIVYNQDSLDKMQKKKIRILKREIRMLRKNMNDELKNFSTEKIKLVKDRLSYDRKLCKRACKLMVKKREEIKNLYEKKINDKKEALEKFETSQNEELFNLFSNEEKINYIRVGSAKKKKIGNNDTSIKSTTV